MKYGLLSIFFLFCVSVFAGELDYSVKNRLDQKGVKYTITKNNDFRVIVKTDNGRDQLVLIFSSTENYKGMKIREISSVGFIGNLTPSISREMLKRTNSLKMGGWSMFVGDNGKDYGTFSIKFVDQNVSATDLAELVDFVGSVADKLEKDFLQKDDL